MDHLQHLGKKGENNMQNLIEGEMLDIVVRVLPGVLYKEGRH